MRGQTGLAEFGFPPISKLTRAILLLLLGAYVAELFVVSFTPVGASLYTALAWLPFGSGFMPWQPVTRLLVQGPSVVWVVVSGIVLYFFLPVLERHYSPFKLLEVAIAALLGSIALGLALNGIAPLSVVPAMGWDFLVTSLAVLFGLTLPRTQIRLFFVLPVPAVVFVWGTGLLSLLFLLATPSLGTADHLGAFLGVLGWWFLRGPGSRRRKLRKKGRAIERELSRFTVLDGGKGQGNQDDVVH